MSNSGSQIQTAVHVRLATAAALATCTYSSAASVAPFNTDLGAKLIATSNGALTVDGAAAVVDDEILVKDQVATLQNGVYRVRSIGSTTTPWSLERSKQARSSEQFNGMLVTTGPEGTANASILYIYSGAVLPTIGTTAITFAGSDTGSISSAIDTAFTDNIGLDDPGISSPVTTTIVAVGGPQLLALTGIRPTGTIAALTLNFIDGIKNGVARIMCTQIVTTVTVTGHVDLDATRSLKAGLTAFTAGQMVEYWWDESGSSPCWVRAV